MGATTFLSVASIIGIVLIALLLLVVLQTLIAPGLLSGNLSEGVPQPCNQGKQWILYSCKPNAITGLGCVVPGSHGRFITYKTVAVLNPTCQAQSISGDIPGERVISSKWQELGLAGPCTSAPTGATGCCNYNSQCTSTVNFLCVKTDQADGGENQCTPQFLPAPFPGFDKTASYNPIPATIQVPCRSNYCGQ